MDLTKFESRKKDHIRFSLDPQNQATGLSGLDELQLIHDSLPELNLDEVSLEVQSLGSKRKTPYYVAGMTSGHENALELNRTLAVSCEKRGWILGAGSLRREWQNIKKEELDHWFRIRKEVPNVSILANLGITQLLETYQETGKNGLIENAQRIIEALKAEAFAIHLNALQEAIQPEGTPNFRGALEALRVFCEAISIPVLIKETGSGLSLKALEKVSDFNLAAVDVSGLGGTHWGRIEGARTEPGSSRSVASESFRNWGVSTVESVLASRKALPTTCEIWASGGVRSGLDAAKLIALGSHLVGFAKPALEAALKGTSALDQWMETKEFELRVALFCTGQLNCSSLRGNDTVWKIIAH